MFVCLLIICKKHTYLPCILYGSRIDLYGEIIFRLHKAPKEEFENSQETEVC